MDTRIVADVYLRLSTLEQLKGGSLDEQREAALAEIEQRGWELGRVWEENESGMDDDRAMLEQMRLRAKRGEIQAIVVWRKARLSRRQQHRQWLFYEFDRAGVEFVSIKDPRREGLTGELIDFVEGYQDENEVAIINERMTGGRMQSAKRGLFPSGAGLNLYGYDYHREPDESRRSGWRGVRTKNAEQAAVVQSIFDWFEGGMTYYQIAKKLNADNVPTRTGAAWASTVIRQMLSRRSYVGETVVFKYTGTKPSQRRVPGSKALTQHIRPEPVDEPNGKRMTHITLEGATPPIISVEQFERVQPKLAERAAKRSPKAQRDYWLRGFVRCGRCGRLYSGTRSTPAKGGKSYTRYQCSSANHGPLCNCHARSFSAEWLEGYLWEKLAPVFKDPRILIEHHRALMQAQAESPKADRLAFHRAEEERLSGLITRLAARMAKTEADELYDALERQHLALTQQRESVRAEIAPLAAAVAEQHVTEETVRSVEQWVADAGANVDDWALAKRREAMSFFKVAVTVRPDGEEFIIEGRVPVLRVSGVQAGLHSVDASVPFSLPFPAPPSHHCR
jgi:site-specific DNA recombinase